MPPPTNPSDGYVTLVTVSVGDRAVQAQGAMSFIVENEITLVGLFSQNGFQTIKEGARVEIVFDNVPGRIYHAEVIAIPKGIGQGQVAVSGTLVRTNALGGATLFPAVISIPGDMSRESLRLGMSGSVTAFSPTRMWMACWRPFWCGSALRPHIFRQFRSSSRFANVCVGSIAAI